MKNLRSLLFPALAVAAAFSSVTAHATTLAADNFTLSSGTNVGTVANAESTGVGTYSTILGTTGMSVTTQSGFGSGNVLSFANNTNTYYREFDSAPFALNSLGLNETITLSLDIRFDGGTFAAAQNFSVGFVADATTDNSILYANLNLNAGSSEFRYRTGSFNMSDAGSTVGTSWTEPTTVSATSYLLALSVTRVGTGYTVDYSRDGNSLKNETYLTGSAWETAVAGADMTGIAFRHSQTPGVTTYLDNVSVTIVPEPTSGLLAIVSVGGLLLRRRRATSLS